MFSNHLPPASFFADHGACISLWPAGENKFILAVTVAMSGSVVNVLAFQLTGRYHVQRQCRVCVPSAIGPFRLLWKGFCSGALFPRPMQGNKHQVLSNISDCMFKPGIHCTKSMLHPYCINSPVANRTSEE